MDRGQVLFLCLVLLSVIIHEAAQKKKKEKQGKEGTDTKEDDTQSQTDEDNKIGRDSNEDVSEASPHQENKNETSNGQYEENGSDRSNGKGQKKDKDKSNGKDPKKGKDKSNNKDEESGLDNSNGKDPKKGKDKSKNKDEEFGSDKSNGKDPKKGKDKSNNKDEESGLDNSNGKDPKKGKDKSKNKDEEFGSDKSNGKDPKKGKDKSNNKDQKKDKDSSGRKDKDKSDEGGDHKDKTSYSWEIDEERAHKSHGSHHSGGRSKSGPNCPGQYQCIVHRRRPKVCVKREELCDGNEDCPNGDNETDCPILFCWSGSCTKLPHDCQDIQYGGFGNQSAVYVIYPYGTATPVQVFCDFDTDGGNWTIFQRRRDASVDFYRNWKEYQNGFGNKSDNYWLGNRNLHALTSVGNWQLKIILGDFKGKSRYATYAGFSIGDFDENYRLSIGQYSGDAGDSLTYHNGAEFSTFDHGQASSCAKYYKGGWWFVGCHFSNLNGKYLGGQHSSVAHGVVWYHWRGYSYSLKRTTMMMRRV